MAAFWPRINTVLLLISMLGVIAFFSTRAFGGPLDPSGPPASSPGGIDGRIPISSLPFTITASGSYVITRNLQVEDAPGITVDADNVTIDLNGFTLDGVGTNTVAIDASGRSNLNVTNGTLRRWLTGVNNDTVSGSEDGGILSRLTIEDTIYGAFVPRASRIDTSIFSGATQAAIIANGPAITVTNSTFFANATAIVSNSQDNLIQANHFEIPAGGIGVQAGDFVTVRGNFFGNPSAAGYVTIALGSSNYVSVIENRMKFGLTSGGTGTGLFMPFDTNNALTNVSP
jgi:hypothetical protein